ncbi:MAG: aromatic amino acid lyase, partial [Acidobacteriia bacterium]|nr:aromatic amino acid lyase [Terriglobia bacterium]
MAVELDGEHLTIEDVQIVAERDATVSLASNAIEKMRASREPVELLAAGDTAIYGVNTGVGLLADIRIPRKDLELLQLNVVRSHAAGVGNPLDRAVVRAMMLIRANVLAKGFSGIRPVVAELICAMLNRGVTPVIPEQGSVGASGDLAPLAHMALVLAGEGEAEFEGAVLPGGEALRRAGLDPLTFHLKEGLSLINGTQAMLSIGCLELGAAEVLADTADVVALLTLDAL